MVTEQEKKAIKWMQNVRDDVVVTLDHIAKEEPNVSPMLYAGRKEKAEAIIKGFEELEQYRAIGNVEEIKANMEELKRWHTDKTNPKIKNVFANTSTLLCHNCDHKDDYIEDMKDYIEKLEAEIDEYRTIGTVEECRAAVEKQIAKKVTVVLFGPISYPASCPTCRKNIKGYLNKKHCPHCGQKLDWGMKDDH